MKIETHLSPNCSEATFVVVNWKTRKILDHFDESNECCDESQIADFLKYIWPYVINPNASIEISPNSGNSFHPEILEALNKLHRKGVILPHTDKDGKLLEEIGKDLIEACGDSIDYEKIIMSHLKSKVELMAEGFYGRKK